MKRTLLSLLLCAASLCMVAQEPDNKEIVKKEIRAFDTWMKDMGKASEQAFAALKGVSDVFKEIKSTPCHSE